MGNEAWKRRCIWFSYGATASVEHPTDSLLGLAENVIINPMEGLIKVSTFSLQFGGDLIHGWQANDWQGLVDIAQNYMPRVVQIVVDPQVQGFVIAIGILALLVIALLLPAPRLSRPTIPGWRLGRCP